MSVEEQDIGRIAVVRADVAGTAEPAFAVSSGDDADGGVDVFVPRAAEQVRVIGIQDGVGRGRLPVAGGFGERPGFGSVEAADQVLHDAVADAEIVFSSQNRTVGRTAEDFPAGAVCERPAAAADLSAEVAAPPAVIPAAQMPVVHALRRDVIAVVADILNHRRPHLFQVGQAGAPVRLFARFLERGQQHRRQNRDDRDDDYDHLLNIQYGVY